MREHFVDDDLLRFRSIVIVREEPSADQPCLERGEIAGSYVALVHFIVLAMKRLADDADPVSIAVALDRKIAGDANRFDSGKGREAADYLVEKSNLLLGFDVGVLGNRHLQSCKVRGVEAHVDVKQTIKAFAQQPCSDQEYDGDGKFDDNEIRAHALPEASCGGTAPVAKPFANVLK